MPQPIVILSSCESRDQAEHIARALVTERLAACVNIVPGVMSIYRWQGEVETASEYLLVIKTTVEQAQAAEKRTAELHSYDTPELIRIAIEGGSERYVSWLVSAVDITRGGAGGMRSGE
jgi:periplasmic divalent cation tolerance protein